MINIAKIISTTINNAGERIVKVLRLGKKDVQEIHAVAPFGDDSNPPKDVRAVYMETGIKGQAVLVGYINTESEASEGERRFFAVDPNTGEVKTYIHLKNDGNLELNGNVDNAVRYQKLKDAMDQLKNDFNSFVSIYNGHIHGSPAGNTTTPTTPAIDTTFDISQSKIDNIKTP